MSVIYCPAPKASRGGPHTNAVEILSSSSQHHHRQHQLHLQQYQQQQLEKQIQLQHSSALGTSAYGKYVNQLQQSSSPASPPPPIPARTPCANGAGGEAGGYYTSPQYTLPPPPPSHPSDPQQVAPPSNFNSLDPPPFTNDLDDAGKDYNSYLTAMQHLPASFNEFLARTEIAQIPLSAETVRDAKVKLHQVIIEEETKADEAEKRSLQQEKRKFQMCNACVDRSKSAPSTSRGFSGSGLPPPPGSRATPEGGGGGDRTTPPDWTLSDLHQQSLHSIVLLEQRSIINKKLWDDLLSNTINIITEQQRTAKALDYLYTIIKHPASPSTAVLVPKLDSLLRESPVSFADPAAASLSLADCINKLTALVQQDAINLKLRGAPTVPADVAKPRPSQTTRSAQIQQIQQLQQYQQLPPPDKPSVDAGNATLPAPPLLSPVQASPSVGRQGEVFYVNSSPEASPSRFTVSGPTPSLPQPQTYSHSMVPSPYPYNALSPASPASRNLNQVSSCPYLIYPQYDLKQPACFFDPSTGAPPASAVPAQPQGGGGLLYSPASTPSLGVAGGMERHPDTTPPRLKSSS